MTTHPRNPDELLRAVELHHEQYLRSLRAYHESMSSTSLSDAGLGVGARRMDRTGSADGTLPGSPVIFAAAPPSPFPHPIQHTSTSLSNTAALTSPALKRARRLTNEALPLPERQASLSLPGTITSAGEKKHVPVSLYETELDPDVPFVPLQLLPHSPATSPRISADERVLAARRPLPARAYNDADLVEHVRRISDDKTATVRALDHVWRRRNDVDAKTVWEVTGGDEEFDLYAKNATYEVYDVDREGQAVQRLDEAANADDTILEAQDVWEALKSVNASGDISGRMTFLQEPSPLVLAGAHLSLRNSFDMDELYQHLVTSEGNRRKTKAYMHRAFEREPLHQRTFFFVFKYYTVVREDLTPAPWQQFDRRAAHAKSVDHIDIAECSSVLALSLAAAPPVKELRVQSRRKKQRSSINGGGATHVGHIADHFAPWHLLSLQCFADDKHSMREDDDVRGRTWCSGPHAFLDALAAEYRDAVKRNAELHDLITKLIIPPHQFMFESKLRDKLLFEDEHFTYSRRYFWAYNTLGVINDGLKAMESAYTSTFTNDFWAGRHQTLWPLLGDGIVPGSPEANNYLAKLDSVRREIERHVAELLAVRDRNERARKEIANLREQLFSGSSVKESRRAIEQGDNIRVLTGVSMLFLPLSFVTSVFGITEFTIPPDDWRFPTVVVSVCVPFFLLVIMIQTRWGMAFLRRLGRFIRGEAKAPVKGQESHADAKRLRRASRRRRRQVGGMGLAGGEESGAEFEPGTLWRRWSGRIREGGRMRVRRRGMVKDAGMEV